MMKNSIKDWILFKFPPKSSSLLVFLFLYFYSFSQEEVLSPIYQFGSQKILKRNVNDTLFTYLTDTLVLPIIDDFSQNHFQKYPQETVGANVKKTKYYKFLGDNYQFVDLKKFSSTLPKKYIYLSNTKKDSIADIPVVSFKLKVADLSIYPISFTDKIVYPNYVVYDTLGFDNVSDTIWNKTQEFFQDSLFVFENKLKDKNAFWLDDNVYRNNHYAINPWTLGVVTFDGLKSDGSPYFINTGIRGYGDYLTSKPINLEGLKLKDSIYFSFLYQPKGFGDAPENINVGSTAKHDSLCLQFYNPSLKQWLSVWSETVSDNPQTLQKEFVSFKKVHFRIKDSTFLKNNFQFRFVNYGDLSGSLDHFHLDYVKFRKNSGYQDTLFKDFAFVYPVRSILKRYMSVPWKHFVSASKKPYNDSVRFVIRNGSNIDENNDQSGFLSLYKNHVKINEFEIQGQKLTNGQVNFSKLTNYTSYFNFSDKINIPVNDEDSVSLLIKANIKASFTNLPENDSSTFIQHFADYYAFDDGSAEAAYGLKSSQACVAYRFSTLKIDSLIGAYMYFLPSVNDKSKKQFALTVWKDNQGKPGEVVYEDDDFSLHNPIYGKKRDEFTSYFFKDFKRISVDTSFFIGMRQIDKDYLNVGFDRNTNTINRLFYSFDKINWNKSQVDSIGSLMIRPIFLSEINKKVEIKEVIQNSNFIVFPNPSKDKLFINSIESAFKLTDIQGREILFFENNESGIDISSISNGVYFVIAINSGTSQKIIIE
jgi:hypothetical protein